MGLVAPGMWDLPGPGLEPVCPALAGGFLTTAPPGKPWVLFLVVKYIFIGDDILLRSTQGVCLFHFL